MFGLKKKRVCEALRPTPSPNHVNCLPGECNVCYTICSEPLHEDENAYCRKCIKTYLRHPSAKVRYAFLLNGIETKTIDPQTIRLFLDDADASVSGLARRAVNIGVASPFSN